MPGISSLKLNDEDAALIAAMELLRQQFATSTAQIAANTQRVAVDFQKQAAAIREMGNGRIFGGPAYNPPRADQPTGYAGGRAPPKQPDMNIAAPGGPPSSTAFLRAEIRDLLKPGATPQGGGGITGVGAITAVLGQLAGGFTATIGPLALLSQVLSSEISGFQVLNQATRLFAATLGPGLLPVVDSLRTGLLAISGILMEKVLPAMDQWFNFMLTALIPAVARIVDAFEIAANEIDARNILAGLLGCTSASGGASDQMMPRTNRGLSDFLQTLRQSLGSQTPISSLSSAAQSAQFPAWNSDPIEKQILKVNQDALVRLDEIARNTGSKSGVGRGARAHDPPPMNDRKGMGNGFSSGFLGDQ